MGSFVATLLQDDIKEGMTEGSKLILRWILSANGMGKLAIKDCPYSE